ncbi:MAG: hypothetical protein QM771_08285 [Nitrospira sp.]
MDEPQPEYPPLTFGELGQLLSRQVENVAVTKVIKDALQRGLIDTASQ